MHGEHAAEVLDANGCTAEAERIHRAVSDRNGLLSAKQAAGLVLDEADGVGDMASLGWGRGRVPGVAWHSLVARMRGTASA